MALTKVPSELSSTPGIVDNSNATAITIDSSENVLVGKSSLEYDNTAGHIFRNDGLQSSIRSGGNVADFNRLSSDGEIIRLSKDGSSVGNIGVESGDNFVIEATATDHAGLLLWGSGGFGRVTPRLNGSEANGTVDLGRSAGRFKDLYLSGDIAHKDAADNARLLYDKSSNLLGNAGTNLYGAGIYLGGTAAANYLDDYEIGTWTPTLAGHYGTYGTTFTQGTRNGVYTRIGNLVTLGMEISSAGVAAANNGDIITITGLPFNIGGHGIVASHAHNAAASHVGGGWTSISATSLGHLGNNGTASGGWSWLTGNSFSTSGVAIRLTVTYRVA